MHAVSLGPFLLSLAVVALILGIVAASVTAGFMARRGHADVAGPMWWLLVAALLVGRITYVLRFWSSYSSHPLAIIDIRDGGFSILASVLVLVVGLIVLASLRKAWRVALPVSLLAGLAVWGLVLGAGVKLQQAAHPPLPAVVLSDIAGQPVAIQSFKGQPTVVNLWATWCGPCRREMPVLAAAQAHHDKIHFVFANQREAAHTVRAYLQGNNLALHNVLLDTHGQLSQHYNVPGYPTTLFLDRRGRLVNIHIGALSHATLQQGLQHLPTSSDTMEKSR